MAQSAVNLTEQKAKIIEAIRAIREAQKKVFEAYLVEKLNKLFEVEEDLKNVYMKGINDNPLLSDTEKEYEQTILEMMTRN